VWAPRPPPTTSAVSRPKGELLVEAVDVARLLHVTHVLVSRQLELDGLLKDGVQVIPRHVPYEQPLRVHVPDRREENL